MIKNVKENDKPLPDTIQIKLTGDGMQIGRGLNILRRGGSNVCQR